MNTYPIDGPIGTEAEKITDALGPVILGSKEFRGETYLFIKTEEIANVLHLLKTDPELKYDYFVECVGVDYLTWPHHRDLAERFEVVYNLYSVSNNRRIFLKVGVNDGQTVPTCKEVYLGAEYPEREIQDLYGILFSGNGPDPNMRFLLPDDWVGFPLRKDVALGGEDVVFHAGTEGPAIEDVQTPFTGESFEGKTGSPPRK